MTPPTHLHMAWMPHVEATTAIPITTTTTIATTAVIVAATGTTIATTTRAGELATTTTTVRATVVEWAWRAWHLLLANQPGEAA